MIIQNSLLFLREYRLNTNSKDYEFSKMADENVIGVPDVTAFTPDNV